jgi:exodeoxyribonuclease VII large subunit
MNLNLNLNIPQYGVTQFNRAFKDIIEDHFSYVSIKGEISEIRIATKGQIYLTLKDEISILSAVVWEQKKKSLAFEPEVGMEVTLIGKVTTWSKFKTTYQVDVDKIEITGEGALLKLIEERKKRLQEKGYFEEVNKKKIPYLPSRIGVITSPTGSVIHDIINRVINRFKTPIDLWPVAVQGAESADNIIVAINGFNEMIDNKPDVIIVARGGGSTEDLMAFNDEKLAEVVSLSKIPIMSAVGHETDTTIIDFVSDLRASTPTAAAELVVPVKTELVNMVSGLGQRLSYGIGSIFKENSADLQKLISLIKTPEQIIQSNKEKLDYIKIGLKRIINNNLELAYKDLSLLSGNLKLPYDLIKFQNSKIENLSKNLSSIIERELFNNSQKYENYLRLIETNSIQSNLKKGYSILSKNNKIINNSKLLKENDVISARLIDKTIKIKINKIN